MQAARSIPDRQVFSRATGAKTAVAIVVTAVNLALAAGVALAGLPVWAVALVWAAATIATLAIWAGLLRRPDHEAIVVGPEGFWPKGEATGPIPWAEIKRISLLDQPAMIFTGRIRQRIIDRALILEGPTLARYPASNAQPTEDDFHTRGVEPVATRLLVVLRDIVPVRREGGGFAEVVRAIRRYHPVTCFRRTGTGPLEPYDPCADKT